MFFTKDFLPIFSENLLLENIFVGQFFLTSFSDRQHFVGDFFYLKVFGQRCFCHTRLHLGFSARLRIWQVPTCCVRCPHPWLNYPKESCAVSPPQLEHMTRYPQLACAVSPPLLLLKHPINSVLLNLYLRVWHSQLSLFLHNYHNITSDQVWIL